MSVCIELESAPYPVYIHTLRSHEPVRNPVQVKRYGFVALKRAALSSTDSLADVEENRSLKLSTWTPKPPTQPPTPRRLLASWKAPSPSLHLFPEQCFHFVPKQQLLVWEEDWSRSESSPPTFCLRGVYGSRLDFRHLSYVTPSRSDPQLWKQRLHSSAGGPIPSLSPRFEILDCGNMSKKCPLFISTWACKC